MRRRDFLKAAGVGAASLTLSGCESAEWQAEPGPKRDRPNLIFIMVDDMGWADLGCYGSQAVQTPHIDRMAAEGIRFTQAYSGCSVCAPARSVLMTGLHTGHTPVRGNTGGIALPDDAVTVAEVLKGAGYATGGFGKWGLGDVGTTGAPEQQGFDEFFGYYHQVHAHYYWPDYLWHNSEKVPLPGETGSVERYTHYHVFERMTDFICRHKDEPFFCYAPWTPPHGRYEIPDCDPAWQLYEDKPWPKNAKVAAAMDTMVDRNVGELLSLLEELRIDEKTIVFFCSDNGAAERFEGTLDSSGPLRGRKRSMYEGGIRVPLIARWPGKIAPGSESDHPCYFADVMPTLADFAGAALPAHAIDGISIAPTLLGRRADQKTHRFMYWEWHLYNWGKQAFVPDGLMQAVRMGDWKAVRHRSNEPFELYDLSADIGETKNVAAEHPEIVKRIEAFIARDRREPGPQVEPTKPEGKRFR
jgi:arylsulfatase A-like enzyme